MKNSVAEQSQFSNKNMWDEIKKVTNPTKEQCDYFAFSDFEEYAKFTSFVSKLFFRILQISPVSIDNGIKKTKDVFESLLFLSNLVKPHSLHYLVSAMSTVFLLPEEDKLLV